MIENPAIVATEERAAAVIPIIVPCSDMPKVMPSAVRELLTVITHQGLAPQGPLFAHHLRMPSDVFDFEVGFPIAGRIEPTDRVRPGALPAATIARTVYRGPYEGLGSAWAAFIATLQAERTLDAAGLKSAGDFWETYLTGPESGEDSAMFRTELNLRLTSV